MEITLSPEMFTDGVCRVPFGQNKEAVFVIVDEEFPGRNALGRINRVNCLIQSYDSSDRVEDVYLGTTVIGLGDQTVGVRSDHEELRGKAMTKDNMDRCVVILYE